MCYKEFMKTKLDPKTRQQVLDQLEKIERILRRVRRLLETAGVRK